MSNYVPKDLEFDQEGRDKLISGISKISKAVKSTLGPRGKTVLIESSNHTRNYNYKRWSYCCGVYIINRSCRELGYYHDERCGS